MKNAIFIGVLLLISSCKENSHSPKLFTLLNSEETNIHFINQLKESEDFDVFRYRNYYNGAGVSIGDINNDGLADIYLTSNLEKNKLYLNLGNFHFKDITDSARVGGTRAWSTGVSMADVNGDGWLDIYVCNSGDIKGDDKENELFINNGNATFTERAKEFGLADEGFSTHAVFFDYDKDGDLDCYLLNNSFRSASAIGYRNIRDERDKLGGDKLFRNDKGHFEDVSEMAGIYGSVIGFGLGVTVGDVNNDNWPDIYVANDFFERDYLYINRHDGTFSESLEDQIGHTSMFSMGADMADLNNDGYLDILSTDMLPNDDYRLKTITSFESYDVYALKVKSGYYHQYMRNMLQLNNQDGSFSEVGQLADVSATDWSWGGLIADFNNDGYKEIFIANGIYRDVTDQDFLDYMANEENVKAALEGRKIDYQKVIKDMPTHKLSNFMFTRNGELHYHNVSEAWGLNEPSFSNGSAYGDLDNDGDLDLVVNNVNQELFVYRNELKKSQANNYLSISFKGTGANTFGIGAKVAVYKASEIILNENMPIRGYQSSMDHKMIIGLGRNKEVDSLVVTWPDETMQSFSHLPANQHLEVLQKNASIRKKLTVTHNIVPWLKQGALDFVHRENNLNEFNAEKSLMQMLSTEGPALAVGDVNKDQLEDFFVGGGAGQAGAIFIQHTNGSYKRLKTTVFDLDSASEDVDAIFFDADNDRDLDLFVVSGSTEFDPQSNALHDRLYINVKTNNSIPIFQKASDALPAIKKNGSCVRVADYDNDGDLDIFCGTRAVIRKYGFPCDQYIFENNGKGVFRDVSYKSPDLKQLGMVTDAQWMNYDGDNLPDLMVIGDWMPITIFRNVKGAFQKIKEPSLDKTEGWWNTLEQFDIDNDGDQDFILGNLGQNTKFKATDQAPVSLYVSDFDHNGSIQQVYTYRKNELDYPFATKQDLAKQINSLNKKFVYYRDYAGKSIDKIFDAEKLEHATILRSYQNNSCLLTNEGAGRFKLKALPLQAQVSPVYSIKALDINGDGLAELIMGGNLFSVKPEVGRYDASYGHVLQGDRDGNFHSISSKESGFKIRGEIREIALIRGFEDRLICALRNDSVKVLRIRKK